MHPAIQVVRFAFAAELYARIHWTVYFKFKFQYKIAVIFFRSQKGVGLIENRSANNHPIFYFVTGFTIQLFPAFQVFAIEKGFPVFFGIGLRSYSDRKRSA